MLKILRDARRRSEGIGEGYGGTLKTISLFSSTHSASVRSYLLSLASSMSLLHPSWFGRL